MADDTISDLAWLLKVLRKIRARSLGRPTVSRLVQLVKMVIACSGYWVVEAHFTDYKLTLPPSHRRPDAVGRPPVIVLPNMAKNQLVLNLAQRIYTTGISFFRSVKMSAILMKRWKMSPPCGGQLCRTVHYEE